jgi:hypothetical protein
MKRIVSITALLMIFIFSGIFEQLKAQNSGILEVRYLPPGEELDVVKEYNLAILELALEKTEEEFGAYSIIESERDLSQQEALKSLRESSMLQVVPTMTDRYREQVFLPVKIPLYKGLFGLRLLMIQEQTGTNLADADSQEELEKYVMGQGSDWPDTQILKANKFEVNEYDSKSELFAGLDQSEYDLFPRSIIEIWSELEQIEEKGLTFHKKAYLYYPTAIYFFTQKNREGLALSQRLEAGLNAAIADGSFDEVFNKYLSSFLNRVDLDSMEPVKLKNPLLPDRAPIDKEEYWYINM